jgi:hypothetical protein
MVLKAVVSTWNPHLNCTLSFTYVVSKGILTHLDKNVINFEKFLTHSEHFSKYKEFSELGFGKGLSVSLLRNRWILINVKLKLYLCLINCHITGFTVMPIIS